MPSSPLAENSLLLRLPQQALQIAAKLGEAAVAEERATAEEDSGELRSPAALPRNTLLSLVLTKQQLVLLELQSSKQNLQQKQRQEAVAVSIASCVQATRDRSS